MPEHIHTTPAPIDFGSAGESRTPEATPISLAKSGVNVFWFSDCPARTKTRDANVKGGAMKDHRGVEA